MGIQGCALVPGQVLHPGFWKGCDALGEVQGGRGVQGGQSSQKHSLGTVCSVESKDPLEEHWALLQDSETCRGFGLAPRLLWQEGQGAQRVPHAPGVPVGEQPDWWQHPKARVQGNSLGTAQDVGQEVLGLGQLGLQQSESAGVCGHACASLLTCVQVCMALSFPWSLLWSGKDSGC